MKTWHASKVSVPDMYKAGGGQLERVSTGGYRIRRTRSASLAFSVANLQVDPALLFSTRIQIHRAKNDFIEVYFEI